MAHDLPATHQARQNARRQAAKDYVKRVLATKSCVTCGVDDPRVLDWHHDDALTAMYGPKLHTISRMAQQGMNVRDIRVELRKCVAMCCNCHRIHHREEEKDARGE